MKLHVVIGGCAGSGNPPTYRYWKTQDGEMEAWPLESRGKFGSLTTSFAICCGDQGVIVDNGTGVQHCVDFLSSAGIQKVALFQTHFHADHVDGLPFNKLLFQKGGIKRIYAPALKSGYFRDILAEKFQLRNWPVCPALFGVTHEHQDFSPGDTVYWGEWKVETLELNHPGGAVGYRFITPGGEVVVATDHELEGSNDHRYRRFVEGADLLLADVQYDLMEYEGHTGIGNGAALSRKGWGHSTSNMLFEVLGRCQDCPKKIGVVHHDPARSEKGILEIAEVIRLGLSIATEAMHEGQILTF